MMKKATLLLLGAILMRPSAHACDCAMQLPGSFCATMDTAWFPAEVVVLGVKLNEVAYGMHIKVLQVFQGDVAVEDTLTVWGDNGACCRWYVNTWANGDTVIWAINETDFMGNWIAPFEPDLEMPGDYCISMCGVYWLGYSAGVVSTEANGIYSGEWIVPGVTSMPIEDFWPAVTDCLGLGIEPHGILGGLTVSTLTGGVLISLPTTESVELELTDASGRAVMHRRWNGAPLWIGELSSGVFVLDLQRNGESGSRKLFVP